ncbi:MAG TPA: hypothetical protein VMT25_02820 [Thermoanaerobaculia bacterium]|nr:hypothetical protein [Thermoanaerobaculia bacterium]
MLPAFALVLALAGDPLSPKLAVDLDGDGTPETVTAAASRGDVRLEVRDAGGKKLGNAKAPAPAGDVVHVALSPGVLGSPGALIEVLASTDASECVSVWRWKDRALTRIPIRDAGGKPLPDCGRPGEWAWSWQREAEDRPSSLVRERTAPVEAGTLRVREVFAFAGFSLDADAQRSGSEINGVPIPTWYPATFYARPALEVLYERFDLSRMRAHPTAVIEADPRRGVFALRVTGPDGERTIPIEASTSHRGEAILTSGPDGKTMRATVRLGGDGSVPYELEVAGLGAPFDQIYAPAGGWRGESRSLFLSAVDELASKDLAGTWLDPSGRNVVIATDGAPPYRVRVDDSLSTPVLAGAAPPLDVILLPTDPSGQAWGVTLRGPNTLERVPLTCGGPDAAGCRASGPAVRLRRLGARMNAR